MCWASSTCRPEILTSLQFYQELRLPLSLHFAPTLRNPMQSGERKEGSDAGRSSISHSNASPARRRSRPKTIAHVAHFSQALRRVQQAREVLLLAVALWLKTLKQSVTSNMICLNLLPKCGASTRPKVARQMWQSEP